MKAYCVSKGRGTPHPSLHGCLGDGFRAIKSREWYMEVKADRQALLNLQVMAWEAQPQRKRLYNEAQGILCLAVKVCILKEISGVKK